MATVMRLLRRTPDIMEQVFERNRTAEEQRWLEWKASVHIQAWFRAVRVRSYLKHLCRCATVVQKHWRGYLGRAFVRILIKNQVLIMRQNFYNAMATIIQKMWRGFYTRKYIFNYYSRKRYLEGLLVKNQIVRQELEEYSEQKNHEKAVEIEQQMQQMIIDDARKHHYLLSTQVVPGVYNSPFKPYPDEMEMILRSVQPRPPPGPKPKRDNRLGIVIPPSPPLPLTEPLPPIGETKLQGPFRTPEEVLKQRFKPLQPTLRVATSYTSVEEARAAMKAKEWVMRVNNNIFEPFTRRDRAYDPLLHTTSKYGHLPYGTHYRETEDSKNITAVRFQPVVSPIPVFEKLNDTYSKGTETVP